MHARENPHARDPKDKRLLSVNGTPQLEYDGLHRGELAWILGRRFKGVVDGAGGGTNNALDELSAPQRYAHQALAGMGNGVDRMQRLASTSWMQSLFSEKLGGSVVNLHALPLDSVYAKLMDLSLIHI